MAPLSESAQKLLGIRQTNGPAQIQTQAILEVFLGIAVTYAAKKSSIRALDRDAQKLLPEELDILAETAKDYQEALTQANIDKGLFHETFEKARNDRGMA